MTSTLKIEGRVLSMAARLLRQGLVKKAQDRYNVGQLEREVLDMYYTAMKVGDRLGSTIVADDTGEAYNVCEYKFPRNIITLATYARVYINKRNRDAGLELFRYNISSEERHMKVTNKEGAWEEDELKVVPKVLSPSGIERIYNNWNSGLSNDSRLRLGTFEQYKPEARYVVSLEVVTHPNEDFAYVAFGSADTERLAVAVMLGYSLPFAYNGDWSYDTVSATDLALWLFGEAKTDRKEGDSDAKD
jgi:hypothetical protein